MVGFSRDSMSSDNRIASARVASDARMWRLPAVLSVDLLRSGHAFLQTLGSFEVGLLTSKDPGGTTAPKRPQAQDEMTGIRGKQNMLVKQHRTHGDRGKQGLESRDCGEWVLPCTVMPDVWQKVPSAWFNASMGSGRHVAWN